MKTAHCRTQSSFRPLAVMLAGLAAAREAPCADGPPPQLSFEKYGATTGGRLRDVLPVPNLCWEVRRGSQPPPRPTSAAGE